MVNSAKPRFAYSGLISENRKAKFDFFITETIEAGLSLNGAEVKSLREGRANISDGYAIPNGDSFYINNISIGRYNSENPFAARPEKRPRQLLLKKSEIKRLIGVYSRKGISIIPLKLYFNQRGLAKVLLGIAEGKHQADKRESIKEREWNRDKARILKINR